jgi:hypothetical protein
VLHTSILNGVLYNDDTFAFERLIYVYIYSDSYREKNYIYTHFKTIINDHVIYSLLFTDTYIHLTKQNARRNNIYMYMSSGLEVEFWLLYFIILYHYGTII